jgi:hypothetical protein
MDSIRNYLGEKEFRMSEILQFGIMFLLSGFLIGGGIIILNDEEIFKKIYEGYHSDTTAELIALPPPPPPPIEEQLIAQSGTILENTLCNQGYEKYRFGSLSMHACYKCPDGRQLEYSDGTPVLPGQIDISKLVFDSYDYGLRCRVATPPDSGGAGNDDNDISLPNSQSESNFGENNGSSLLQNVAVANNPINPFSGRNGQSGSNFGENNGSSLLQNGAVTTGQAKPKAAAAAVVTGQAKPIAAAVSNTWTADLPDELLLVNLQKNVKLLRKKSLINTITAWTMIVLGSIISIYQIYNMFFS